VKLHLDDNDFDNIL